MVAGRLAPCLPRTHGPAALHRGARAGPHGPRRRAPGSPGDDPRLPVGRDRLHRPPPAAVRRGRGRGGGAARADVTRLRGGRVRVAAGRRGDRHRRRSARGRRPAAAHVDLGGPRHRRRGRAGPPSVDDAGVRPDPREILALAGPVSRPAWSPDGRWLAVIGVDDPDFFDDVSPTLFVGPSDGSGPARALAPDLDRPVGSWADTDLTGWQGEQTPGPAWDGPDGVVALVTDRGRTHPWRFPVDPRTGRASRGPVRLVGGDLLAHTLAVGGGRVTVTATIGARPPELCVVDPSAEHPPADHDGLLLDRRPRVAGHALRGCAGTRRTDRDLDRVTRRCLRRRGPADRRGHPRRTVGSVVAGPEPGGRAAVRPRLSRGAAQHPRFLLVWRGVDHAAAGRLGRPGRRGRARGAGPCRAARPGGPGSAGGARSLVRRVHGQLARGHDGPVPGGGVRERRDQPGLGLGAQRQRARVLPRSPDGRPHDPGGRGAALAAVAAAQRGQRPDAAAAPPVRGGPALPGRGQRAVLRGAALAAADGGVRDLPGGVPRDPGDRPDRPAHRPHDPDARLVRPVT